MLGASIDTGGLSAAGTAFANYCTTLAIAVPAEIAVVGVQQTIQNSVQNSAVASGGTHFTAIGAVRNLAVYLCR